MAVLEALQQGISRIAESIRRKKGGWVLASEPQGVILALGSYRVVNLPGGFLVSIKLEPEELLRLRETCDEILRKTSQ